MRFALISAAVVLLLGRLLSAEEPEPIKPIELTLQPRAIEAPALQYRLLPAEVEIKPGNAVPILLRLPWEQTPWMNEVFPKLHEWQSRPLSAPEWTTSGGVLPDRFYSEIKRAAFRRAAGWEYPLHETQTPYLILLPDVQGLRGFLVHGLSARIRYHLFRGEPDQAREAILVGLANGRHLAQTPFFVNQLVAVAIQRNMLERTAELISQPNSPNLYWALSTLPDSLIELDRAASLESSVLAMTFPAMKDLDRPRDAEEWSEIAGQSVELLQELGEIPRPAPPKQNASLVERLFQTLNAGANPYIGKWAKHARAELPQLLEISAEKVADMSDDEAAVRWYMHLRQARDQHACAVLVLSPQEAWPQFKQLKEEFASMQEKTGAKELDLFDPISIYVSVWTVNRKVQSLRIIEAVRDHLATHEGELPAALNQIKDVPIPLDPLTNQPLQWKVEGKTATLKAPPLPADVVEPGSAPDRTSALEYRLQVK